MTKMRTQVYLFFFNTWEVKGHAVCQVILNNVVTRCLQLEGRIQVSYLSCYLYLSLGIEFSSLSNVLMFYQ